MKLLGGIKIQQNNPPEKQMNKENTIYSIALILCLLIIVLTNP